MKASKRTKKLIKKRLFYKLKSKVAKTLEVPELKKYGRALAIQLNHLIHNKGSNFKKISSYVNWLHKRYKIFKSRQKKI